MTWFKCGALAQAIIDSLEQHPEKWRLDEYTIWIGATKSHQAPFRVWISNGWGFVRLYSPVEKSFSMRERWAIWRAFQAWKLAKDDMLTDQLIDTLKKAEEWDGLS